MAGRGGQPVVYQIDFTAVASGKRIASSKRRIRWRFGFANAQALAEGQTGTNCRGEEHDVTIIWSVTSGKRVVMMDGKETHYSNSRNNVFEYSWTMRGNHVLKLLAHASPPMSPTPGFRQYDFYVDGQSFFTFPKVFRLGLSANDPRGASRSPRGTPVRAEGGQRYGTGTNSTRSTGSANIANIEAPHNPDEEEAYLREAIKNSLKDAGGGAGSVVSAPPTTGNNLLLDFSAPAPAHAVPALPGPAPAPGMEFFGAPPAAPPQQYAALPPSTNIPQGQPNGYAAAVADPWGAPGSVGAGSYGTAPPAATYQPPAPAQAYGAAPADPFEAQQQAYGQPPAPAAPGYGAPVANPFGAPDAGAAANPFGAPPQQPPPQQPPAQPAYGQPETPRGAVVPGGQDFATPTTQASTLGFASPVGMPAGAPPPAGGDPFGAPPAQAAPQAAPDAFAQPQAADPFAAPAQPPAAPPAADPFAAPPAQPAAEPAQNNPALLSMNTLSGQQQPLVTEDMTSNGATGTMADQAYNKLVNMDAFDLVKGKEEQERANPFDMGTAATTMNNSTPLAALKNQNSSNVSILDTILLQQVFCTQNL